MTAAACYPIPRIAADLNDSALLDAVYGLSVTFMNPAVPFCYPAQQMTGVILDVKTSPRGCRQLLVKAPELSLPKYVALDECQFVWVVALESEAG